MELQIYIYEIQKRIPDPIIHQVLLGLLGFSYITAFKSASSPKTALPLTLPPNESVFLLY